MSKISIVGSYPPNYGGISIHVQRLHLLLAESHDCRVMDLYSVGGEQQVSGVDRIYGNKLWRVLSCRLALKKIAAELDHFHVSAMRKFLWGSPLLLMGSRTVKRVLTIHGGAFPEVVSGLKSWEKSLFRWMLARFDFFVCVSEKQRKVLDDWGVSAEKIAVINAYLPPVKSSGSGIFAEVEREKATGRVIFLCAGQYLEHYGVEELTRAVASLASEAELDFRVVLLSYAEVDEGYRSKCLALRESVADSFFEFDNLDPTQVAELMALADVFVRPTWWDGDAISVREAAFFGNRLIATDVTTRPVGALQCSAKNVDSLAQAIRTCIVDQDAGVVEFDHYQSLRELMHVYKLQGIDAGQESVNDQLKAG